MASQAEIDLVVNASNTLNELEGDLDRVVRAAQASADPVTIAAVMDQQTAVANVLRDVDRVVAAAQAGAPDIDLDAALNQQASLRQIQRQLSQVVDEAERNGSVSTVTMRAALNVPRSISQVQRDLRRVINVAEATTPDVVVPVRFEVDRDSFRRFDDQARRVATSVTRAGSAVLKLVAGLGALGLAAGAAAPLLAGVVAAAQQLAPAAAVATQGILAMQLATGTLKLALSGVQEAIETAFDPEASAEDLAKALEKLSPNARAFVKELRGMRSALTQLRLQTQNLLFQDLAGHLGGLARRVLPVARDAIRNTAIVLNDMALSAANAAGELAEDGTLRTAIQGTVRGLRNLQDVPGRIVTAFGQLAAASAPAFARITQRVNQVSAVISERLNRAFESGGLERAIDGAVSSFGQLLRVARNVGATLGNVFDAVSGDSGTLFDNLEKVTGTLSDITASSGFQDTLGALAEVMRTIGSEVGPLLLNIFEELGPVFTRLASPVQRLVEFLGENLNRAVDELGPVLEQAAIAFDKIEQAVEPLLQIVFDLVIAALPGLSRAFEFVGTILDELRPGFERLSEALGPLFEQLSELHLLLQDKVFTALERLLGPLIDLAVIGMSGVATIIEEVVVPQLEILNDLLNGDSTAAFQKFIALGNRVNEFVGRAFESLKLRVVAAVNNMVASAQARFGLFLSQLVLNVQNKLNEVVRFFQNLPSRISGALGNLGNVLFSAGVNLIDGLIRGVQSRISDLLGQLANLARTARDVVAAALDSHSPSRVFAELGDDIVGGLQLGIERSAGGLRRDLTGLALSLPQATREGLTLTAPQRQTVTPDVTVMIGNEVLDSRTDARIRTAFGQQNRLIAQGVRR